MPYGRTLLTNTSPYPTRVSADGSAEYKTGGIVLDLTTVTAASGSDITLPDGSVMKANTQFMRYGQVLCKITTAPVHVLTQAATGGTFTLTLLRPDTQQLVTTAAIAWNASAATVLAAIQAVLGANQIASATGGPLNTTAVTLTFNQYVPIPTVNGALLTGGVLTPSTTTAGTSNGKWGPYDFAATDGRQTVTRGNVVILDETWLANPAGSSFAGLGATDTIGGVIEGGRLWYDRVLQSGVATHSLALGPNLSELEAAMPRVSWVDRKP
jgi:hypothetical protein